MDIIIKLNLFFPVQALVRGRDDNTRRLCELECIPLSTELGAFSEGPIVGQFKQTKGSFLMYLLNKWV